MKSVLLHVTQDQACENRLQIALDLVREFGGHLTCCQVVPFEIPSPGDFYGMGASSLLPVLKEDAEKLRETSEQRLRREGIPYDWQFGFGMPETHLAQHAALADVIVAGPYDLAAQAGPSQLVGWLAIHARTPVLVPSPDHAGLDVDGPVLVAWNGSPEAGRAVRGALPVLRRSAQVVVASAVQQEDRVRLPSLAVMEYLSRHGVSAELRELPQGGEDVGDMLKGAARECGATLMVQGAYGHSRLSQMIFGGVTHRMLKKVDLPLLLAH